LKLSALLAPLIAAKADHATIMEVVLAFESEHAAELSAEAEALLAADEERKEKGRVRWHKWKQTKVTNVSQRLPTAANASQQLAPDPAPVEDNLLPKKISGQEENKEGASPAARSRRGSPIPDDFLPDIEAAVADGLSRQAAELMAKNFVDYWHAKPGKEGLKLDWPATWRVWYRRDLSPANRSGAPPRQARRNFADVAMDRMNGHGPKGVFSTDGDAERISAGKRESRPDDGNLRGGIAGRYIASDH
jgi:hypothetical protein